MPLTFFSDLLKISSREVDHGRLGSDRRALLQLAVQSVKEGAASALLWLVDDGPSGLPELRLSYAYDPKEDDPRPSLLRRIAQPVADEPGDLQSPSLSRVLGWFRRLHGVDPVQKWLPIQRDGEDIGRLHLLLGPGATEDWDLLALVGQVFADTVTAERRSRPAMAVQHFQTRANATAGQHKQLQLLAETARHFTTARHAILYRPQGADLGRELAVAALDGVATDNAQNRRLLMAGQRSLTFRVFHRLDCVRLCDINDPDEIMRLGYAPPNPVMLDNLQKVTGKTRAWMAATVAVKSLRGHPLGALQIKLLDKNNDHYLHDAFTRTDQDIIRALVECVVEFLPRSEQFVAQGVVADALAEMAATENLDLTDAADLLVAVLKPYVHGIDGLSFSIPGFPPVVSSSANLLQTVPWRKLALRTLHPMLTPPELFVVAIRVGHGALLVQMRKDNMPLHEYEILEYAAGSIALLFQSALIYSATGRRLMEIRHAVRSSVQGMVGYARNALDTYELAREHPQTAEELLVRRKGFARALENAAASAAHAMALLEETRWTTKGKAEVLRLGRHSLAAIVAEVVRFARIEAAARRMQIRVENTVPPELDEVDCDRGGILISIQNMVENAIKYGLKGAEIVISIAIDKKFWRISVLNIGTIIKEKDAEEIFKPGVRIVDHSAIGRGDIDNFPGTGLGLSICRAVMEAHAPDASIAVTSTPFVDAPCAETVFTLSVPRNLKKSDVS